jgi:hypothetical protein
MGIGLGRRRPRAVSLEQGAEPGSARCPACAEPLFAWLEIHTRRVAPVGAPLHNGPLEDQIIDRCESCGLVVARDAVPTPDQAIGALLQGGATTGDVIRFRAANADSVQAWLGAENWAALTPADRDAKPTLQAAELLLRRRGLEVKRVRYLAAPGIASMWQTLLNLLTFHRDFAPEAIAGRLRPNGGGGRAAFGLDAMITILAAVPAALIAVVLEMGAVAARRGGVIEITAAAPDRSGPT